MIQLAAADSLLGQLQRGRGAGFLQALQEDPASLHPLLIQCVIHEPRWDRQIETRSDYYAALIIHTGLPLDAFDAYLHELEQTNPSNPNDLVLATICTLAERGYDEAARIVHDYLYYGQYWEMACVALVESPNAPKDVRGMDKVICDRFPNDQDLSDELCNLPRHEEPWRTWGANNPRIKLIFKAQAQRKELRDEDERRTKALCATLSTSELLALVVDKPRTYGIVTGMLRERATETDIPLLIAALDSEHFQQSRLALRALTRLAPPSALPALRSLLESSIPRNRSVLGFAGTAIAALPGALTLGLARQWLDAPQWHLRHAALCILEEHATPDDVPRVREMLTATLLPDSPLYDEHYIQTSLLDILADFPAEGPYPEIEQAFREAGHSWTRINAAEALLSCEPERFSTGLALECLWDCEERVRLIGCKSVDATLPGAQARLYALRHDQFEEEDIRDEAQARLINMPPLPTTTD